MLIISEKNSLKNMCFPLMYNGPQGTERDALTSLKVAELETHSTFCRDVTPCSLVTDGTWYKP